MLREKFKWHEDECTSRSMGAGGEDILLSPRAREAFPFSIECKNSERINIYSAYQQARENSGEHIPVLIYKRNRRDPLVIMSFEDWVKMT